MSLIYTKPVYTNDVIATDHGWVDAKTGELLIAIKNLKSRLAEESLSENVNIYTEKSKKTAKPPKKKSSNLE